MRLQVIQDSKGRAAGVFIPMNEWQELKKKHKDLKTLEEEPEKEKILRELKEAIIELNLIKKGKLKARPAKDLLDEL